MEFRHSISLLGANLTLIYRVLSFLAIMLIIVSAILVGVLTPLVTDVREQIASNGVTLFNKLDDGIFETINFLTEKINIYLDENPSYLTKVSLYFGLTFLLIKFLLCLSLVPASKIVYDKMKTGYATSFFGSFLSLLKQSLFYAFFAGVLLGAVDVCLIALWWLMIKWLYAYVSIVSIGISTFLLILVFSARMSLFSQLLPCLLMSEDKNPLKILKLSLLNGLTLFGKNYPIAVTIGLLFVSVTMTTILPTFGIIPLVFTSVLAVLYCTSNLTCAFNYKKMKYYPDGGFTVFEPRQ